MMSQDDLQTQLIDLDAIRSRLSVLKEQESTLSANLLAELRRRKLDAFDFLSDKRAVVERPASLLIDPDQFADAARALGCGACDIADAIKRTVSLPAARKLLGEDALAEIGRHKLGAWRLRMVAIRPADH